MSFLEWEERGEEKKNVDLIHDDLLTSLNLS